MKFDYKEADLDELIIDIRNQNNAAIHSRIEHLHPADLAELMDYMDFDSALYLLELLDKEAMADVLVELEEDVREKVLAHLSSDEIARELIDELDSDDAADIIAELPEEKAAEVLKNIEDEEQARDIVDLMRYDEDTAGGLMGKEMVSVNVNWTVLTCVREMRRQAEEVEQVHRVFVVDDNEKLLGTLSLKKLLTTSTKTPVGEVYNKDIQYVNVNEKDEDVANIMQKYDLFVIPVVDDRGRLVGRITIDDVVDVIRDEADKDYQMASGISQDVESHDTIWALTKARLPWLLIGLFGGIMSGKIIGAYEIAIAAHPQLVIFIPLIAAMGGNVGVQSSAIVVQGLASGSLKGTIFQLVFKEFGLGIINGTVLAAIVFGVNLLSGISVIISSTICLALVIVICNAAIIGTMVPMVLEKNKIDPAIATGPFITTTNDILGVFIYFSVAKMMLG